MFVQVTKYRLNMRIFNNKNGDINPYKTTWLSGI